MVALCGALSQFRLDFDGFYAKELRTLVEHHLGRPYTIRQTAHDLRRLGLQGPARTTARLQSLPADRARPPSHPFCARLYNHVFCPGLARLQPGYPVGKLNQAWRNFESELDGLIQGKAIGRLIISAKTRLVCRS